MAEPENRDSGKRGPRNDRRDDRRGPAPERRDAGQSSRPPRRDDARDEEKLEGKDFIYGARTVMEAMEAGRAIDKILMKKGLDSELRNDVYDLAQKANIPIQVVPVEKLDRTTKVSSRSPFWCRMPIWSKSSSDSNPKARSRCSS